MPVFTAKSPDTSSPEGLRAYLTELVSYLRFLLENLDGDNIPSLRKRSFTEIRLNAEGWKGNSAPYTYVLTNENVTETSTLALIPSENISAEELKAFQKANVIGGKQLRGRVTLKAWGEKPETDVRVGLIIF